MTESESPPPADRRYKPESAPASRGRGLMRYVDARLEHIPSGQVTIVLPRTEVTQQHGYVQDRALSRLAFIGSGSSVWPRPRPYIEVPARVAARLLPAFAVGRNTVRPQSP